MPDVIATPRSRRAVLAGSMGAVAALVAQAIGRPVSANQGDALVAGSVITGATSTTGVTTNSGNGLQGTSSDGIASGVFGQNTGGGPGVAGNTNSGSATTGFSQNGNGVAGVGFFGYGVYGEGTKAGVLGKGRSTLPGVAGWSAKDDGEAEPTIPQRTGVYGYAVDGANARGVIGQSTLGRGVSGIATSGVGVYANATLGLALETVGRVMFSTAGLASIAVGAKSTQITPGTDLATSSLVLCTLESNQAGLSIQRVAKNTATDKFTVYLSAKVAAGKAAKVAWFVIG